MDSEENTCHVRHKEHKSMSKVGRPVKYTHSKLIEISKAMEEYTDSTDIPILLEFAYQQHMNRQEFYKHDELRDSKERLINKKEAQLEKLALTNVLSPVAKHSKYSYLIKKAI